MSLLTRPVLTCTDFTNPEIDALYKKQAVEAEPQKRTVLLHQIQQIAYDEVRFIPLFTWVCIQGWDRVWRTPVWARFPLFYYTGPFEDMQLKGQ